jgi:ABC-type multidrug transport system fused ATPase/permease subunit
LDDSSAASLAIRSVSQTIGKSTLHHGLSLELDSGTSMAIMGPAGTGKSALMDLITGVRRPSSGHITLDGIDIREFRPDSLREHVSLARGIEIFHGTIEENVHLHRPQINASDVREALAAVGLLDELMGLPEGLNTFVQTDGAPLTSSQSLRLMIARAIVDRPRLLLIDGTLDSLGDEALQATLAGVQRKGHPWTLLATTGRKDIAARFGSVFYLRDKNTGDRRASSERSLS